MAAIFEHNLQVPASALDVQGHVNNVQFVQWMQDAAVAHSDAVGCTAATAAAGAMWVARAHKITYQRPAFLGEHLRVLTWVADFRRAFSKRKYKFIRSADRAVLATGETDWAFVDLQTGRPRSVPADITAMFELVAEEREP